MRDKAAAMLQLCQVPFCSTIGHGLRSDADKARVVAELRDSFGVQATAPRPWVRYRARDHARDLRGGGRYVAALRPRGAPVLLYLTRVDGCGVCMFVYRRLAEGHLFPRVVLVRLSFAERAFDGTLLEGELVRVLQPQPAAASERWVFSVGDVLVDCGQPMRGEDAVRRLERVHRLLSPDWHRPDLASDPCFLRARQHFTVAKLRGVLLEQVFSPNPASTLDYEVTGVVFRSLGRLGDPGEEDVVFSFPKQKTNQPQQRRRRQQSAEAEAEAEADADAEASAASASADDEETVQQQQQQHSADEEPSRATFFIRRTAMPDVYELYETAEEAAVGRAGAQIAGVPTMAASEVLRNASSATAIEFELSRKFNRWIPVLPRREQPRSGVFVTTS